MKTTFASIAILISANAFAMGNDQDYFFSIYGDKAQSEFTKLPKLTDSCAYIENKVDANGNTVDTIKMVIQGQQINSVLCRQIGEQTFACEASTLWNDGACKTN